jgi:hypothetical protein
VFCLSIGRNNGYYYSNFSWFALTFKAKARIASRSVYDCLAFVILQTRVEAGSNTSTVTLLVVRGDEMGLKKAAP